MAILNRSDPPCMGFTCSVEVAERLQVKEFALSPGAGQGRILSNPPRLADIYKNAMRVTHTHTHTHTHTYIYIYITG